MIKLLHAADLHLGSPFRGLPPEKAASRRSEQRRLPELLADLYHDQGCDGMLLSGDLFDGTAAREDMEALTRALERCGPVFIAPGNHDFYSAASPYHTARWPRNVHIFTRPVIESVALPELDLRVWGAGFRDMDCPGLLAGFTARGPEAYQVMVLHGDPTTTDSPCCPVTRAQAENSGLHYLALGHIHKGGAFRAGTTLCAWPGCPMGRGFDETGDKGALIVTLDGEANAQFFPLSTRRYQRLTLEAGSDPAAALENALPAETSRDIYRVIFQGEAEDLDLQALKDRFTSRFYHLELRDETVPKVDTWESAGEDTLEGLFFRKLRDALGEAGPDEQRQLVLAARLVRRFLDGRQEELS